tara:strand:+ start:40 stop:420 length:381 start_codon:yes stop_codon:yes gene_type:complete
MLKANTANNRVASNQAYMDKFKSELAAKCDNVKVRVFSHNLKGITETCKTNDLSIFNGHRFMQAADDISVSVSIIVVGTEREEFLLLNKLTDATGCKITGSYDEEMSARYFDLYCEKEGALLINLK